MTKRAYYSNLARAWSSARQEAAFRAGIHGWPRGVTTYQDCVSPSRRKAHDVTALVDRVAMVRPTSRKSRDETIYVAALPCLAYHEADLMVVLQAISERAATLIALDVGLTLPPNAKLSDVSRIITAFREGKRRSQTELGGKTGAQASAEKRAERGKGGCDRIADRWPLPSPEHPTKALLAEAGVCLATAKKYLGSRKDAQRARENGLAQARRNQARRKLA